MAEAMVEGEGEEREGWWLVEMMGYTRSGW